MCKKRGNGDSGKMEMMIYYHAERGNKEYPPYLLLSPHLPFYTKLLITTFLKIYNKIWELTKDKLEKIDEIVIIGFSFNEFDEYVLDEFKKINFKKNVKVNIISPEGYLRIQKFSDIFRTDAKNIKVIHAKFSSYCEWIIQQNGMTDLQEFLNE